MLSPSSTVSSMDRHSPWPDLCRDMLDDEIAKRLHSDISRLCIRAVCHSWRSLLPLQSRPPLRLPFPMCDVFFLGPKNSGYFKLVHSTVYCLQPLQNPTHTSMMTTKSWLIRIEETEEPGKVRLKDPLSRPPYSRTLSPALPKGLNLLDYRVSEVTRVYDLLFVDKKRKRDCPRPYCHRPAKVAVCSEGPVFAVIAIDILGPTSIWRKGDEKWTCLGYSPYGARYIDVVCHKGKFYALDLIGTTVSVDLLSLEIALVTPPTGPPSDNKRLLSDLGDLFLLHGHTYFHVSKLIEDKHTWVPETNLGDRAIFVCEDCIFCVPTQECVGCKMNCIYYKQPLILRRGNRLVREPALFDMQDCSAKMLSQVVGYSGLFWPPPSWILTWYVSIFVPLIIIYSRASTKLFIGFNMKLT